jgi:hypothetical protein
MTKRRDYEMSQTDLDTLLLASRPVPYIVVGGIGPDGPQTNANSAWRALGKRMGFEWMTVLPSDKGERFFTAIPLEDVTL